MKKTLYILQDGELHRKDNSLYFESKKGRKFIPVESTNDICVFGNVAVSKRFLDFCTQKRIPVHYFGIVGDYLGTYYPREYYNSGFIAIRQVEYYLNNRKRLVLAKAIATGYINQTLKVIKYYINRKAGEEQRALDDLYKELEVRRGILTTLDCIEQIESFIEETKKIYWGGFNFIFNNSSFICNGDKDSLQYKRKNNIIQFGEALGQAIILSEVYKTHLDPRVGYLHESNLGFFPLCLDILYIFKPIMIHRLIFTLINKSVVTNKDYINYKNNLILSKEGKGKVIIELDKRLRTTIKHRQLGRHVSYRRIIRMELYKIQKHIVEGKEYMPYSTLW